MPLLIVISEDRQESGRERRGETCSKGCHEWDSNMQHAVRPEPYVAYAWTIRPAGRPTPEYIVFVKTTLQI